MAHRLPNHQSKCQNLHGHRYVIEVGVDDKVISQAGSADEGMVIDFADLKAIMMQEIDTVYDHNAMFAASDPVAQQMIELLAPVQAKKLVLVDFVPTVENIAKHFYELVAAPLQERGIQIKHVKVWETPNCTATFTIND